MPFSYIKILLYCNKNNPVSVFDICNEFRLTKGEANALMSELKELGYVYYVGCSSISTTYKGKTVILSLIYDWIFKNFLPVIALIISIIALFK